MTAPTRACGTRSAYVAGCDCTPCRAANTTYEAGRTRLAVYSRPTTNLVDAGPARARVRALMAGGMGIRTIAVRAGVSRSAVSGLIYGRAGGRPPARRVTPATAAALLAVPVGPAPGALVDAAPTWRLVHGLIAWGYPRAWIARQLGARSPALQLGAEQITTRTADAVAALVERTVSPGPSGRARAHAAARGWTPDLLWPDDNPTTNDRPNARRKESSACLGSGSMTCSPGTARSDASAMWRSGCTSPRSAGAPST